MMFQVFTICGLLIILACRICAQPPENEKRKPANPAFGNRSYFPFRKKPTKEQKKQLQPRAEDLSAYEQFLRQPKTGIFRILPDLECEANTLVIKADETCLKAIPGSSFYSFREREHTQEVLADIRLKDNYFISDGILSQGILVVLGDVVLQTVTPESAGLKFLNNYLPPTLNKEAQKQFLQMTKGIVSGGYEYGKIVPAKENATYALRVIAYKGSIFRTYQGFRFDLLDGDKRIDLTLAFRVIRKEKDGGLTLLWKEMARRESPKIKFEKRNIR